MSKNVLLGATNMRERYLNSRYQHLYTDSDFLSFLEQINKEADSGWTYIHIYDRDFSNTSTKSDLLSYLEELGYEIEQGEDSTIVSW